MSVEKQAALATVEMWVRDNLEDAGGIAHGWPHTDRVRHYVRVLARAEGVDPFLAELAALLHDVGRSQPGPEGEHGARSAAMAAPLLAGLSVSAEALEKVLYAVRWHNSKRDDTRLLCVLRDADMLDGLGAIGLMRAFMSKSHLPAYNPKLFFEEGEMLWPATYASDQVRGQMKFYDLLNTETGRQMAEDRIAFMRAFVVQAEVELGQAHGESWIAGA
jgi:uncharacterized protein